MTVMMPKTKPFSATIIKNVEVNDSAIVPIKNVVNDAYDSHEPYITKSPG
jgi:hypothetical protein